MTRLPEPSRDSLSSDGQRIWDEIANTRSGIHGAFTVLMYVPELAEKIAELGDYFKHTGKLSGADRELAILSAAREMGSPYEWARHEPRARSEGVRDQVIESVRTMSFSSLNERELLIVEVVQTLFRTSKLPAGLFDKAVHELGRERLVELVALAGFYCLNAFIFASFDLSLPADSRSAF